MSQCVPSWDLDDDPSILRSNCNSMAPDVSMLDYQVAELTWENGQLAMHSLGPPRATVKHFTSSSPTTKYIWEKPRASGTLESIVNQATRLPENKAAIFFDSRGWFDRHRSAPAPAAASATMSMDALVPSSHNPVEDPPSHLMESVSGPVTTGVVACVGSCTGAVATTKDDEPVLPVKRARADRAAHEWSQCESATFGRESQQVTLDTCERDFGIGFTSTSLGSPDTSSGKPSTRATTTADDHDSVCHSISQREIGVDEKKKGNGKSSGSTKRSRAAAVHNQSERKRRDKINERMKTLQKLVPNSNKTDKASMLDEVIEYLKQLQAQISMISRMNMPYMMLSMAMQQQLQMSMMAPMGMGMGVVDHMNTLGRPNIPGISPLLHSSAFMPLSSWDGSSDRLSPPATLMDPLATFLAYQSQLQPMTMDAYSRMAALYQQLQQHPASSSKS